MYSAIHDFFYQVQKKMKIQHLVQNKVTNEQTFTWECSEQELGIPEQICKDQE
jgi:hypothetical protein